MTPRRQRIDEIISAVALFVAVCTALFVTWHIVARP
jgi:hypothetical protein